MEKLTTFSFTYNVSVRYSDERDYRIFACGIDNVKLLKEVVSDAAGLCGIQDIRIAFDLCDTDLRRFTL